MIFEKYRIFGSDSVALCEVFLSHLPEACGHPYCKGLLALFFVWHGADWKKKSPNLEFYFKLRLLTLIIQWSLFVKSLFFLELRLKMKYIRCPFLCIIKFFFFFFFSFFWRKSYQLKWSLNCSVANLSISGAVCINSFIYHKDFESSGKIFFSCFIEIKRFLIKADNFSAVVIFLQMLLCV